jgi:hypothetical protein
MSQLATMMKNFIGHLRYRPFSINKQLWRRWFVAHCIHSILYSTSLLPTDHLCH